MTSIRTVIIDDEPLTRERVRSLALEQPDITVVGEARNGLEALDVLARESPDLIIIDVEMPELDGFGVIAAIEADRIPVVIFITAYERYALKAFEVGAIDYLHKPVTRERFAAAIQRARERLPTRSAADWEAFVEDASTLMRSRGSRSRYVVRRGTTHYFLPVADIDWIEAADNYLELHAAGRTHLVRGTMRQAEGELDAARFMRVHRSTIVAVDRIASVAVIDTGGFALTLLDGTHLRGSRQFGEQIRTLLTRHS